MTARAAPAPLPRAAAACWCRILPAAWSRACPRRRARPARRPPSQACRRSPRSSRASPHRPRARRSPLRGAEMAALLLVSEDEAFAAAAGALADAGLTLTRVGIEDAVAAVRRDHPDIVAIDADS